MRPDLLGLVAAYLLAVAYTWISIDWGWGLLTAAALAIAYQAGRYVERHANSPVSRRPGRRAD
jgi:hypothetical protein